MVVPTGLEVLSWPFFSLDSGCFLWHCGSAHDSVWSEVYCFIFLLFGGHCSIVPLSTRLLFIKNLLSVGLFSRHTRRQHTRLLFNSVGGVSIGRIVYINT